MSLLLARLAKLVGAGDFPRRRRYGVRDGWRLLVFDTPEQAQAAERALSQSSAKRAKALRRIAVREVIALPALRARAIEQQVEPRYEKLIAQHNWSALIDFHAEQARQFEERAQASQRAREEEELAMILLHL